MICLWGMRISFGSDLSILILDALSAVLSQPGTFWARSPRPARRALWEFGTSLYYAIAACHLKIIYSGVAGVESQIETLNTLLNDMAGLPADLHVLHAVTLWAQTIELGSKFFIALENNVYDYGGIFQMPVYILAGLHFLRTILPIQVGFHYFHVQFLLAGTTLAHLSRCHDQPIWIMPMAWIVWQFWAAHAKLHDIKTRAPLTPLKFLKNSLFFKNYVGAYKKGKWTISSQCSESQTVIFWTLLKHPYRPYANVLSSVPPAGMTWKLMSWWDMIWIVNVSGLLWQQCLISPQQRAAAKVGMRLRTSWWLCIFFNLFVLFQCHLLSESSLER